MNDVCAVGVVLDDELVRLRSFPQGALQNPGVHTTRSTAVRRGHRSGPLFRRDCSHQVVTSEHR